MKRFLSLALLAACAGPRGDDTELTPVEALPESERALLQAWRDDDPAWPELRARALESETETRFLVENLTLEMVRAYHGSEVATIGELHGPYERARAELIALSPRSIPTLATTVAVADDVVAYLAGDVLIEIGGESAPELAKHCADEAWPVRRRAVELLGRVPPAGPREGEVLDALERVIADDPEWIVRAEAANALGRRGAAAGRLGVVRPPLERALFESDDSVAEAACKALVVLDDRRAIPALLNYLERIEAGHTRPTSLKHARSALLTLSGLPERTGALGEAKPRSAREWRKWWLEEGGRTLDAPRGERHSGAP